MSNTVLLDEEQNIHIFPEEDTDIALNQGYRLPTAEEQPKIQELFKESQLKALKDKTLKEAVDTPLGKVAAFTGGAADTLTLGAFKKGLKYISPESAEVLDAAQEENPISSGAGTAAGFVGSLAGAPAKIISEGGAKVLEKTGSRALSYGAEGVMAALPSAAVDVVGGDYKEAAENIALSGAFGATLGSLVSGAEYAGKGLKNQVLKYSPKLTETAEKIGTAQGAKQLGMIKSVNAKLLKKGGGGLGATQEEINEAVNYAKQKGYISWFSDDGLTLQQKVEGSLEKIGQEMENLGTVLDDQGLDLIDRESLAKEANKIADDSFGILKRTNASKRSGYENTLSDMKDYFKDGVTFKKVSQLKAAVKQEAFDQNGAIRSGTMAKLYQRLERVISSAVDKGVQKADEVLPIDEFPGSFAQQFQRLKKEWRLNKILELPIKNLVNSEAGNNFVKPSDIGLAGLGGIIGGFPAAFVGYIGNYYMKKWGAGQSSLLIDKLLATSKDIKGRNFDGVSKLLTGTTSKVSKAKLPSLFALNALLNHRYDDDESVDKVSQAISEVATNPELLTNAVTDSLAGVHEQDPQAAAGATQKIAEIFNYLSTVAPQKFASDNPFERTETSYTNQDVSRYKRRLNAALNPQSILDDAANGTLDPTSVETVKTLYPMLYQSMVSELLDQATSQKKQYSYKQKYNLSLLLGKEVSSILEPAKMQVLQQSFVPQEQQGQSAPKKMNSKQPQTLQTETERIMGR